MSMFIGEQEAIGVQQVRINLKQFCRLNLLSLEITKMVKRLLWVNVGGVFLFVLVCFFYSLACLVEGSIIQY